MRFLAADGLHFMPSPPTQSLKAHSQAKNLINLWTVKLNKVNRATRASSAFSYGSGPRLVARAADCDLPSGAGLLPLELAGQGCAEAP